MEIIFSLECYIIYHTRSFLGRNYFFQLTTENIHGKEGGNYLTRYLKKGENV